jgi:hypothetical protein
MNYSLSAAFTVVKAAASRRTPKWARRQDAAIARTWGAGVLRRCKGKPQEHSQE